jgi:hypothetical protein
VLLSYSDSAAVTVSPYVAPSASLTAIQINDLARKISYTWVKNSTYPSGSWLNNMAGTGLTNAPAGQSPLVTPGTSTLSITASIMNNGSVAATFTVTITNVTSGANITTQSISCSPGAANGVGISFVTINMPTTAISINVAVTP